MGLRDFELFHEIAQFINAKAHEMAADLAGMNIPELHPLLELRLTHGQEFARALQVHVASEIIDARELMLDRIADGANQDLVGYLEVEHTFILEIP